MATDDIVTRLQNECQCSDDCRAVGDPCISMRAADEIERLRGAAKWAVDILKNDERLLEEARQLIDLAIAQAEKWKDLASEYYYLDPKCECHLCDRFREAIDDGNR